MKIFLTGATGNIGRCLVDRLRGHEVMALVRTETDLPAWVTPIRGDLASLPAPRFLDAIIHAAADTRFKADRAALADTNIAGTENLLRFARQCPGHPPFIHLSTTCVRGTTKGLIPETRLTRPAAFLNSYEETKWEAEERVFAADLPGAIVRLATACGEQETGRVARPGAFHRALLWLQRGLVPMIPGAPGARIDLISVEFAANSIAKLVEEIPSALSVRHVSGGVNALALEHLLSVARTVFRASHRGWENGTIDLPAIVDGLTFALFRESVRQSGDALFNRVLGDADAFLPGLLHPHVMATKSAFSTAESEQLAQRVLHRLVHENPSHV